jgi:hypothetical protein
MLLLFLSSFKRLTNIVMLSLVLSMTLAVVHIKTVAADEQLNKKVIFFNVKPSRCVALHKGQVCYQALTLSWKAKILGRYCIYSSINAGPVRCWESAIAGRLELDFQSPESVKFSLRADHEDKDLISSEVSVAWVYKSRGRPRTQWRLF